MPGLHWQRPGPDPTTSSVLHTRFMSSPMQEAELAQGWNGSKECGRTGVVAQVAWQRPRNRVVPALHSH